MGTVTNMRPSTMAEKALEIAWNGQFPVDPVAIADSMISYRGIGDDRRQYRITIEPRNADVMGKASGFASFVGGSDSHFLCGYNVGENPLRHRFSQAYELGHVLLGHIKDEEGSYRRDETFSHSGEDESAECLEFVFSLLMPERHVRHMTGKITNIDKLARFFGVSPTTIRERLKSLRLI